MSVLCRHLSCSGLVTCHRPLKISPLIKLKSTLLHHGQTNHLTASLTSGNVSTYMQKNSKTKPLVIMLPWLGSTQKAVSKYAQLYEEVGCNVVVNYSKLTDFLWPKTGLENSRKFLLELKKNIGDHDCPIIVHSTSIGCYFYALMLLQFENNPETFGTIKNRIKVQVLDSPVVGTLYEMAVGAATVNASNETMQSLLKAVVLSYFAVSKPFTVSIYNKAIDIIKYNSPKVPSLIMSSTSDPMALPAKLDDFIKVWKENGIKLNSKIWTDSTHAQHLKYHQNEYKDLILSLLHDSLLIDVNIPSKL